MTDEEINANLFGHVTKTPAPVEQTVAVPQQIVARPAPAPKAPQAAIGSAPVPQAPMPDANALARQAAESSNIVNRDIEQPVAKPALSSLHEAYPWLAPLLGAAGAAAIGQGIYKSVASEEKKPSSISDRMFRKEPTLESERFGGLTPPKAVQLESQAPQFSGPQTTPAEVAAVQDPAKVMSTPEQVRKEKLAQATAKIDGRPIPSPAITQPPAVPVMPAEQITLSAQPTIPAGVTAETEVGKAPKDIGLVERSEQNKLSKQVSAAAPKGSVPAPVAETKKSKSKAIPAYKEVPEGMVFRSDVGNLDRSLVNILGPEGRLYAKDVLNEGKMFGNYKGADYNKKVGEIVSAYGEKLKEITPSIDLTTREGRIVAGAPHTQNYGNALGKAAKVGGVLGTLMTVAQSANAREAAGNVAESLLPIGMTPSELQSGKLTAKQIKAFEEAQKLGSPYRSVPPPR